MGISWWIMVMLSLLSALSFFLPFCSTLHGTFPSPLFIYMCM